jgi:hypothetical protein
MSPCAAVHLWVCDAHALIGTREQALAHYDSRCIAKWAHDPPRQISAAEARGVREHWAREGRDEMGRGAMKVLDYGALRAIAQAQR